LLATENQFLLKIQSCKIRNKVEKNGELVLKCIENHAI